MILEAPPPILTPDPGPFRAKRKCAHKGCITRLHRNHAGRMCYVHEEAALSTAADREARQGTPQDFFEAIGRVIA